MNFEQPNNWKLQIRYVQKRDEGLYECQVSTHPPKIKRVFLSVTVPKIEIRDPRGMVVNYAYYRVDSTVGLQCVVVPAAPSRSVWWRKDGDVISTQPQRGIRVDSSMVAGGLTTWLHIARAAVEDSGNYTCAAGDTITAHVRVHVLDGESSVFPVAGGEHFLRKALALSLHAVGGAAVAKCPALIDTRLSLFTDASSLV
ncbi:Roundabout 1-like protein [Penaeus vannamei]|uniref:Roundabout 1-like protein n=1 Tax=Penaeus vannamei TaxID=6689 RepID=A0A3R7NXE2_PENVA|nr:Roundabout 1-like protein [Penaeus vannamei]